MRITKELDNVEKSRMKRIGYLDNDQKFANVIASLPDTVNIVGNASSLLTKGLGDVIDKHYTIRFNYPDIRKNSEHLGSRVDWLQCNLYYKMPVGYLNEINCSVFTMSRLLPDVYRKSHNQLKKENVIFLPSAIRDSYCKQYKSSRLEQKPSAGWVFINMIHNIRPDIHINLFGFDWKDTPSYYQNTDNEKNASHDFEYERKCILELIDKNNWNLY